MKTVTCSNCGAKYRLENWESSDNFECTACAGNLVDNEILVNANEEVPNGRKSHNNDVVSCQDCGLKHVIEKNENINDFKCSSCGGDLYYIHNNLDTFDSDNKQENVIYTKKTPISQDKNEISPSKSALLLANSEEEQSINIKNNLKEDFLNKINAHYNDGSNTVTESIEELDSNFEENPDEDIEDIIRRKIQEKEESKSFLSKFSKKSKESYGSKKSKKSKESKKLEELDISKADSFKDESPKDINKDLENVKSKDSAEKDEKDIKLGETDTKTDLEKTISSIKEKSASKEVKKGEENLKSSKTIENGKLINQSTLDDVKDGKPSKTKKTKKNQNGEECLPNPSTKNKHSHNISIVLGLVLIAIGL
ncbi:MAG: hypothetical protein LBR24_00840, partial [Methanobrevibacter sp.]|nr:hypothetical protein [Methanobrevibacter sp.]